MSAPSTMQLLLSALGGGLLSAGLSFIVRVMAENRVARLEMKRSAEAAYIQLTDAVATSHIIREYTEAFAKLLSETGVKGIISHKVAIAMAAMLTADNGKVLKEISPAIRSCAASTAAMTKRLSMGFSDLSKLPPTTIFLYGQWAAAAHRFEDALDQFLELSKEGEMARLDGQFLHGVFLTYQLYVDASRILRGSYALSAQLDDQYAIACVKRSYDVQKQQIAEIIRHHTSLNAAMTASPNGELRTNQQNEK